MILIASALTPRLLPPGVKHFEPDFLLEFARARGFSIPELARRLGISRPMVYYLLAGERSPTLDSYLRMLAVAEQPLGTWLRGIGPKVSTPSS
jgi:transcriptional regulator with XRE-family HTH domain